MAISAARAMPSEVAILGAGLSGGLLVLAISRNLGLSSTCLTKAEERGVECRFVALIVIYRSIIVVSILRLTHQGL
ncbi:MAG: hypothetical protein P8J37_16710 [Fuerstiella sp.]|nr:hypothetical protein [Fuerstiella sp.]